MYTDLVVYLVKTSNYYAR